MKTTSISNQVIDTLQWSSAQYEEKKFEVLIRWCAQHGKYLSVIQQILANASVNRWFNAEFEKLEVDFLRQANVCRVRNVQHLEGVYNANIVHIFEVYPSALLEQIKRNRNFTNHYKQGDVESIMYAN